MLSTWNGLDSVALKFDVRDAVHLKGTMKTGNGSCPRPGGRGQAYARQRETTRSTRPS
jgi:hypothetical protein